MTPLSLDRVAEGRHHYRMLIDAIHSSDRPDVDPSLVGRFNDFGELEALAPAARQRLRYVMITHANDAVGHFGLDLCWSGRPTGSARPRPERPPSPGPSSGAARQRLSRRWST